MASNTDRIGHKIQSSKLIKRGLLITPLMIGNAYAGENTTYNFDLPAQPCPPRWTVWPNSAHTKLIYSDATVKGVRAAPVKGKYTAQQAMNIALGRAVLTTKWWTKR